MISVRCDHCYCNCPGRQPSHLATPLTYLITPCSRVLLKKLTGLQLVKKPSYFMYPKVHYCIRNFPPPVPIMNRLDPVHTPTAHFLNIHFNTNIPSTLVSLQWTLSLTLTHQKPVHVSPITHTRYVPRPSHSSRFITGKNFGEQYRSLSSTDH